MKAFLILILLSINLLTSRATFDDWFTGEELRADFILSGDHESFTLSLAGLSISPEWSGTREYIVDPFYYGNFYFTIIDEESGKELFRRGFNTLFGEWQTTIEAKTIRRAFENTVRMPLPKNSFLLEFYQRTTMDEAEKIISFPVDPHDFTIEKKTSVGKEIILIREKVQPGDGVDLLFIAEGYTSEERAKFIIDTKKAMEALFSMAPYSEYEESFNIRGLFVASPESGPDNPGTGEWHDTPAETRFYTFGSERYLTSVNYWKIQDLADGIPNDHLVILVNTEKYGGGGIYNHFTVYVSDHQLSGELFLHELGHGLAGLGDEYYDSEVAYSDFYSLDQEPLAANLTTLVDFDRKWKSMVAVNVPVPTPVSSEFNSITGVYEGGGYSARGIYRPYITCRMKENEAPGFCPVCRKTLSRMIRYYSGMPLEKP